MLNKFKKVLSNLTRLLIVVSVAVVVTSYYRPIQQTVHKGIANVYNINESIGEALYHINGFLFNGKHFDIERSQKFVIYENYTRVVIVNVVDSTNTSSSALNGRGTGFFVKVTDTEGYIVTNHHVISKAIDNQDTDIKVQTAEQYWTYDAEIVGWDHVADIGVIKITKQDNEQWKTIEFADREDYNTGDPVIVIGHGMGMPWTTSQGHITHANRVGLRPYTSMLQTDAVINQGNSGGPVLNLQGNVVGVAQAIYSPGRRVPGWDGVGVAVSAEQSLRSYKYIMSPLYATNGYVPYAEFPFSLATFELEDVKDIPIDERHMTYINYPEVKEGEDPPKKTVGELAGLLQGDILMEINGQKIDNSFNVLQLTLQSFPNDIWNVKIKRGEEIISLEIAIKEIDHNKIIKSLAKAQ